jgi:hypothetical protein
MPPMTLRLPHPVLPGLVAAALAAGCAPTLVAGTMSNPARSTEKLQATQEYDVGPYKENHRFTMTLKDWSATSLGVDIKLVDFGDCGLGKSYSFTLVDDAGGRHPLRPAGEPVTSNELGRGQTPLNVTTLAGTFDVAVAATSHAVTIEQRPLPGTSNCTALDFKWTFQ